MRSLCINLIGAVCHYYLCMGAKKDTYLERKITHFVEAKKNPHDRIWQGDVNKGSLKKVSFFLTLSKKGGGGSTGIQKF